MDFTIYCQKRVENSHDGGDRSDYRKRQRLIGGSTLTIMRCPGPDGIPKDGYDNQGATPKG